MSQDLFDSSTLATRPASAVLSDAAVAAMPLLKPEASASPDESICFFDLTLDQLKQLMVPWGKEVYRANQLYKWVYDKRVQDFSLMSNLSKAVREELALKINFAGPKLKARYKSVDGTRKFIFETYDQLSFETVLIPSEDRWTLCVSSEVGCNMACKFCFTGKQKLKRRLRTSEIVGQFLAVEDACARDGIKVTNIVFMGMGEPLDNVEAVFNSIKILHEPFGRNFSRRRVTVSTSGIVPEMWRVAEAGVRLAVSLNGYDEESRTRIMPINKRYPLAELLKACRDYTDLTGDRVTFEYVLLKGVTDQLEHARKLVQLVKNVPCKINIIPFNEHPGSEFERPSDEQVLKFQKELMYLGAHVLLRRTMGRDIFAACGQLVSEYEEKPRSMDISNSRLSRTKVHPAALRP